MSNIYEKLAAIQQAIKVPKDLNNDFAGFKYRSAETIIEKLKPLMAEHKVVIWLTDEVEDHSEQSYIRAWAHILNLEETGEEFAVSALAREEKTRPKMSEGQLTGAASSYARKYALNGLLLLDDNKDPDSQDNTQNVAKPAQTASKSAFGYSNPEAPASDKQKQLIATKLKEQGVVIEDMNGHLTEQFGVTDPKNMTMEQSSFVIESLIGENA